MLSGLYSYEIRFFFILKGGFKKYNTGLYGNSLQLNQNVKTQYRILPMT